MQPATRFRFSALLGALPPAPRASGTGFLYAGALDLLVAPAEWALVASGRILCAAARELHRAYRARRADEAASILGVPTATEIAAAWTPAPRPLRQALLIGGKLVDLSAAHPLRTVRDASGKARGRTGGLRPWFRDALPDLPYSTAMRHRQLARLLRQALDIPPAIPLEWLLVDASPGSLTHDAALLPLIPALRRKVAACLSGFRTHAVLKRALEKRIDIAPCPFARRSSRRTPEQRTLDLAADAARLDRYIAVLSGKLRANSPLSPPEQRDLAYLRALGIPLPANLP